MNIRIIIADDHKILRQGLQALLLKEPDMEMVAEAESRLSALGCPKLNVLVRTSNPQVLEFYRKLGFSVDEVVNVGKRLEKDVAEPADARER